MISKYSLHLLDKHVTSTCTSCSIGESSKLHLSSSTYKSSHILDLLFCDVWRPAPVTSFHGHRYFLLCVDHFSRFMWFFPLKAKSDVYNTFKQFILTVEWQFQTKLKSVQTDWGSEFRNLSQFFSSLGITHHLSCPHTSEQNALVCCGNRSYSSCPILCSATFLAFCFWYNCLSYKSHAFPYKQKHLTFWTCFQTQT